LIDGYITEKTSRNPPHDAAAANYGTYSAKSRGNLKRVQNARKRPA
jgi:hypothetical protein